jgi:nitrile hydratase beta subunit
MNGVHDLGGMHGFGAVEYEQNEPPFHAPWERTVRGLNGALLGRYTNIDAFRHSIERMGADRYLATSYYEHWLAGMEILLDEVGIVTADELDARTEHLVAHADVAPPPAPRPVTLPAERPQPDGHRFRRAVDASPRFQPGDAVVTRNLNPPGHTRLPRYARGKRGVVELVHGAMVFPDTNAHDLGEHPQYVYNVRFDARELWGEDAEPNQHVNIDMWESYLRNDE